jgi:predicted outer membrane protein
VTRVLNKQPMRNNFMNRAKTVVATAVMAACGAWPLASLAQSSSGTTTYGSGQPSGSAGATSGNPGPSSSPTAASMPATNPSPSDRDFVMNAASGGMLEVEASRLALEQC